MSPEKLRHIAKQYKLEIDEEVIALLNKDCVVATGVSGGKDSDAVAIQTNRFLDAIGNSGPRILIHSDLGLIEHADSLPQCERLAEFLNLPLLKVHRKKGDMIAQWKQRWSDNLTRYRELLCISLIPPFSSASLRFCTKGQKVEPITQELTRHYPNQPILNVVGLRREESASRAKNPTSKENNLLKRSTGCYGRDWFPILGWSAREVVEFHDKVNFPLHYAYRVNGNSRVSCSFCVLSSLADLQASLRDERNHAAFQAIIALELESAFSFQPSRWLAEIEGAPISASQEKQLEEAKLRAAKRRQIEARIPSHLRFEKGWPTFQPLLEDCTTLASIRRDVASLYNLSINYTTGEAIYARYAELLEKKAARKVPAKSLPVIQSPQLPLFSLCPDAQQQASCRLIYSPQKS